MTERVFRSRLAKLGLKTTKHRGSLRVSTLPDTDCISRPEIRITPSDNAYEVFGRTRVPRPDFYGSFDSFDGLLRFVTDFYFGDFPKDWRIPYPASQMETDA